MHVEFDPHKDSINRAKHGLSLAAAQHLTWDQALTWMDDRYHYGEVRMAGLVPRGDRLYHVVFVEQQERFRIISLRPANGREINRYVKDYY